MSVQFCLAKTSSSWFDVWNRCTFILVVLHIFQYVKLQDYGYQCLSQKNRKLYLCWKIDGISISIFGRKDVWGKKGYEVVLPD